MDGKFFIRYSSDFSPAFKFAFMALAIAFFLAIFQPGEVPGDVYISVVFRGCVLLQVCVFHYLVFGFFFIFFVPPWSSMVELLFTVAFASIVPGIDFLKMRVLSLCFIAENCQRV